MEFPRLRGLLILSVSTFSNNLRVEKASAGTIRYLNSIEREIPAVSGAFAYLRQQRFHGKLGNTIPLRCAHEKL